MEEIRKQQQHEKQGKSPFKEHKQPLKNLHSNNQDALRKIDDLKTAREDSKPEPYLSDGIYDEVDNPVEKSMGEERTKESKLDNLYDNLYDAPTKLFEESYDNDSVENNLIDDKNKKISKTSETTEVLLSQELPENEKPFTEFRTGSTELIDGNKKLEMVKPSNDETQNLLNLDPSHAIYASVNMEKKRNSKKEKDANNEKLQNLAETTM